MIKKKIQACLLSVIVLGAACGCAGGTGEMKSNDSGKTSTSTSTTVNTEPVTLVLYPMYSGGDDFIQKVIVEPVAKKFPNVTLNVIPYGEPNQDKVFEQFVAAGAVPDLMMVNFATIRVLNDLQLAADMTELNKANKVDVNKFNQQAIQALKTYGNGKEMLALPYYLNLKTLMYNKDIFDKFGIPYPKDGMTWQQATELSKSVARMDGGIQYLGLQPGRPYELSTQLGQQYLDPTTRKPTVNTEGWKKIFTMLKNIYAIDGNLPKDTSLFNDSYKAMIVNRVQAMGSVWWNGVIPRVQKLQDSNTAFNWDLVTTPVFEEAPGKAPYLDQFAWSVSSQTKHKEIAFEIVNFLTSSEMQLELSKKGQIPAINDKSIQNSLGAGIPWMKGKNVQALFKDQYTLPMSPVKEFNANTMMNTTYGDIMYRNADVNTALRKLEETMTNALEKIK
jgi:multiple sugar transport system substrate-binding protein